MFKNKGKLFILTAVNVFIWGYVGWMIYTSLHKNVDVLDKVSQKSFISKKQIVSDTLTYQFNYADPFLKSDARPRPVARPESTKNNSGIGVVKNTAPRVNNTPKWPVILFQGLIKNNKSNKITALLSIDNKSFLLEKNDTAKGLKIKAIYSDSISIIRGKEVKYIHK